MGCIHSVTEGCHKCCDQCNYDTHICPGCGTSLKHGETTCAACLVYYDIKQAIVADSARRDGTKGGGRRLELTRYLMPRDKGEGQGKTGNGEGT